MGRHNLTAFVYDKRNRLIAVGRNSYTKTHPLMAKAGQAVGKPNTIFLHAEIDALVKVKDWSKIEKMVVVRYTRDGQPALAKPCPVCQRILKPLNIIVEHT